MILYYALTPTTQVGSKRQETTRERLPGKVAELACAVRYPRDVPLHSCFHGIRERPKRYGSALNEASSCRGISNTIPRFFLL